MDYHWRAVGSVEAFHRAINTMSASSYAALIEYVEPTLAWIESPCASSVWKDSLTAKPLKQTILLDSQYYSRYPSLVGI